MDKTSNNLTGDTHNPPRDIDATITTATTATTTPSSAQSSLHKTPWFDSHQAGHHQKPTLPSDNLSSDTNTLELLAERPVVDIQRVVTGNVTVSKHIRTKTINVPITLTQEILVIEHTIPDNLSLAQQALSPAANGDELVNIIPPTTGTTTPIIMINGEAVTLTDKPLELVVSQQVANVSVTTEIVEQVAISTKAHRYEQNIPITLRHEELVIEETKHDMANEVPHQNSTDIKR